MDRALNIPFVRLTLFLTGGPAALHLLLGAYIAHLAFRAVYLTFAYPSQVRSLVL